MSRPLPPPPGLTPPRLLRRLADLLGEEEARGWCVALLRGEGADDDPRHPPIEWLGGTVGWPGYWTRVWGARGLLHLGVGSPDPRRPGGAAEAVIAALADPAWRVREMSLKVVTRHEVDDPDARLEPLLDDPVERVRRQARRALGVDVAE